MAFSYSEFLNKLHNLESLHHELSTAVPEIFTFTLPTRQHEPHRAHLHAKQLIGRVISHHPESDGRTRFSAADAQDLISTFWPKRLEDLVPPGTANRRHISEQLIEYVSQLGELIDLACDCIYEHELSLPPSMRIGSTDATVPQKTYVAPADAEYISFENSSTLYVDLNRARSVAKTRAATKLREQTRAQTLDESFVNAVKAKVLDELVEQNESTQYWRARIPDYETLQTRIVAEAAKAIDVRPFVAIVFDIQGRIIDEAARSGFSISDDALGKITLDIAQPIASSLNKKGKLEEFADALLEGINQSNNPALFITKTKITELAGRKATTASYAHTFESAGR